jgi:hypothetical protein
MKSVLDVVVAAVFALYALVIVTRLEYANSSKKNVRIAKETLTSSSA